jgi:hypothetical protein
MHFKTAENFTSDSRPVLLKTVWINRVGAFQYYAHVLAGFDAVRADAIFDLPADDIASAFVSKICYEYVEQKK